jgi:hypothetical protein
MVADAAGKMFPSSQVRARDVVHNTWRSHDTATIHELYDVKTLRSTDAATARSQSLADHYVLLAAGL